MHLGPTLSSEFHTLETLPPLCTFEDLSLALLHQRLEGAP
jgi:hypothetical protein